MTVVGGSAESRLDTPVNEARAAGAAPPSAAHWVHGGARARTCAVARAWACSKAGEGVGGTARAGTGAAAGVGTCGTVGARTAAGAHAGRAGRIPASPGGGARAVPAYGARLHRRRPVPAGARGAERHHGAGRA